MSTKRTISTTTNYRLFKISESNRSLNLKKHGALKRSMQEYGYIKSMPIVCCRDENKNLIVLDGQHRLAFAEELGLPVCYVVEGQSFDIATINSTAQKWTIQDYAENHASKGLDDYADAIAFSEGHRIPIGMAFSLLGGTTSFSNVKDKFLSGCFKVTDREWAESTASLYVAMCEVSCDLRVVNFLKACMAMCRVHEFDHGRLVSNAKKCREKLHRFSTRDAFLEMCEEVYNFNKKRTRPLKFDAIQALKERNPLSAKKNEVAS